MQASIITAQILGLVFFMLGISLVANKKVALSLVEESIKSPAILWLFGFISVTMGAVILAFNSSCNSGLEIFITIIGTLTLIKGVMILIFPNATISIYKKVKNGNILSWAGVLVCVLALVLQSFVK